MPLAPPPSLESYPGSKAQDGVYHRIIGQMPPHRTYIEAFVGGGAIFRFKRPAERAILVDANPNIAAVWKHHLLELGTPGVTVLEANVFDFLADPSSQVVLQDPNTVLYLDPPYLESVRTKLYYRHELTEEVDHARLLGLLMGLGCNVMLSGYRSKLYDDLLPGWRSIDYNVMTRGGKKVETLWMNFPEPQIIHDVRFAGKGYRENERIKKLKTRWVNRLRNMNTRQRQVILEAIQEVGL